VGYIYIALLISSFLNIMSFKKLIRTYIDINQFFVKISPLHDVDHIVNEDGHVTLNDMHPCS
jgi:hypothetical protein